MVRTAILAGELDGVGQRMKRELENRGWQVLTLSLRRSPPREERDGGLADAVREQLAPARSADMIVLNLEGAREEDGSSILAPMDDAALTDAYDRLCLRPLRVLNALMPYAEAGEGKRICLVTTGEGSQSLCDAAGGYGRRMALAAVNMAFKLLFNQLRPRGYTFRMYCRDLPAGRAEGAYAAEYFARDRSFEPEDPIHSDENRLALHDALGGEIPW